MINYKNNIKIEGRYGTWYEIDRAKASDGRTYILFESEKYGDETAYILCILPEDNQIKRKVGKLSGKEYVEIPHEFEVEETYDPIDVAIEQDLGLDIVEEDEEIEEGYSLKEDVNCEITEEERDTIKNFFQRQQLLWDNYPEIVDDYFDGDAYVVVMGNSNPTYLGDTRESLSDLCHALNVEYDEDTNNNGSYAKTYTFYHCGDELNEDVDEEDEFLIFKCGDCGKEYKKINIADCKKQGVYLKPETVTFLYCPDCEEKHRKEALQEGAEWTTDNTIKYKDIFIRYEGCDGDVDYRQADYIKRRRHFIHYATVYFSFEQEGNKNIEDLFLEFKISEEDLNIEYGRERWDDPGVYPNGASGYPLPSYEYTTIEGGTLAIDKNDIEPDFYYDGYQVTEEDASKKSGVDKKDLEAIVELVRDRAYKGLEEDAAPVLVDYLADNYEGEIIDESFNLKEDWERFDFEDYSDDDVVTVVITDKRFEPLFNKNQKESLRKHNVKIKVQYLDGVVVTGKVGDIIKVCDECHVMNPHKIFI